MPAMRIDAMKARQRQQETPPSGWKTLPGASLAGLLTRPPSNNGGAVVWRDSPATPTAATATATAGDDDEDDCALDASQHEMNYYVIIVFHSDADSGPCNPVVQVVHLAQQDLPLPVVGGRAGAEMLLNCQLCGSSVVRGASTLRVEAARVTAIHVLSLTDLEANMMIANVHEVNLKVSRHDISVSQRSNFALLPRALHKSVPVGLRALDRLSTATAVTDVQLGILVLRESLSRRRGISVPLQRLHPFFATPSNLQEAVSTFTRKISVSAFLRGQFIFMAG